MGLLRTILALVILAILLHIGMAYIGIEENTNDITAGLYALGELAELPMAVLLEALPLSEGQRSFIDQGGFYTTALIAAAGYFILFLLLGVGRS